MAAKEALVGIGDLAGRSSTTSMRESWGSNGSSPAGWVTAVALLFLLIWQLLRTLSSRRQVRSLQPAVGAFSTTEVPPMHHVEGQPAAVSSSGIAKIISEEDLKILISNVEGNFNDVDTWDDVIDKKNDKVSYNAKCCRPKDAPVRYLSVTVFENCSIEILRDFYMDNEFKKGWDKTVVDHEQLEVDFSSGTEVGRTIKKFPLLSPREYVLAWRLWEGNNKSFYCLSKDCQHPLAPQQKKYVRVRSFRSGWRIRKVSDRDACEVILVHEEDAGLNIEMAKLAFAKGIWSYVCKMDTALREYASRRHSYPASGAASLMLIQVPPGLEDGIRGSSPETHDSLGGGDTMKEVHDDECEVVLSPIKKLLRQPSKKLIAKGLLVIGGIVCLSKGHSVLGSQIALACILKKLVKHEGVSSHAASPRLLRGRRSQRQHN